MHFDNSFDAYFGLKNKEIYSLYIEATILEQNQNQKKKKKLVLEENSKTRKKHEDVYSLY